MAYHDARVLRINDGCCCLPCRPCLLACCLNRPCFAQAVEIDVTKHESVTMHAEDGTVLDKHSVACRITYTAVQDKNGAWRLSEATEEGTAQAH